MIPFQTIQKSLQVASAVLGAALVVKSLTETDEEKRRRYQNEVGNHVRHDMMLHTLEKMIR